MGSCVNKYTRVKELSTEDLNLKLVILLIDFSAIFNVGFCISYVESWAEEL